MRKRHSKTITDAQIALSRLLSSVLGVHVKPRASNTVDVGKLAHRDSCCSRSPCLHEAEICTVPCNGSASSSRLRGSSGVLRGVPWTG